MSSIRGAKGRALTKFVGILVILGLAVAAGIMTVAVFQATSWRHPVAGGFTPTPPPSMPAKPFALWVGDSFTEGTGADGSNRSYARVVSAKMGWYPVIDAQGGTGFVADGKNNVASYRPLPARLDSVTISPQVVIVDAGRNDGIADFRSQTAPAVRAYLDKVRLKWPESKIVLVVPYFIHTMNRFAQFEALYAAEAKRVGALIIDPLGEGWITAENGKSMLYTDGIHPNDDGHAYIARKLEERLASVGYKLPT